MSVRIAHAIGFVVPAFGQFAAVEAAEAQFYAAVYFAAACAGVCRTVRDNDYQSVSNLLGLGACSGFLGFVCVSLLSGGNGSADGFEFYYWGVAALVGLLGKEQDKLIRWLVKQLFAKFGIKDDDNEEV